MFSTLRGIQFGFEFLFLQSLLFEQHIECILQFFVAVFIQLVQQRFLQFSKFVQCFIQRRVRANESG